MCLGRVGGIAQDGGIALVDGGSGWSVIGIGDFNGDGKSDILWQNSNGSTISSIQALSFQGSSVTLGSGWSIAGLGDYNGDGKSDILWRNSNTGSLVDWTMNGATITAAQGLTNQGSSLGPLDTSWNALQNPTKFGF